jgi:hypothetical protein
MDSFFLPSLIDFLPVAKMPAALEIEKVSFLASLSIQRPL